MILYPTNQYLDDMGYVLWFHVPLCEPPECRDSSILGWLKDDEGNEWYTHFAILPKYEKDYTIICDEE